jgi:hypothetical protein
MIDFDSLLKDTGVDLNAATIINELLEDATRAITKTKRFLVKQIISKFFTMSETDAVNFRLKVQLIYSMLLESDKVFLAVSNPEQYLRRESKLWQSKWIDERIGKTDDNTTNRLRQKARCEVVDIINRCPSESIYTLTAPTGIGFFFIQFQGQGQRYHSIFPGAVIGIGPYFREVPAVYSGTFINI